MYIYQLGADVVASGSGAINTAGISLFGNTGNFIRDTQSSVAKISVGPGISTQWQGISGPTSFGPGGQAFATSVTGTVVDIVGSIAQSDFHRAMSVERPCRRPARGQIEPWRLLV